MLHFFHVDLLEESADIDALDQLHDDLLEALIISLSLLILLDHSSVAGSELLRFSLQAFLLRLELRESELLLDDVLLISNAASVHLLGIFFNELKSLLSSDLQVKHVLALDLFITQLLKHRVGLVPLVLKLVLELHLHLSLSLEILGLLVGLSDTAALDLVLELVVLLVNAPLLRQRLFDLVVAHELLVVEVLDA